MTFSHPFTLAGIEGSQPAGVYRVETVDVLLDSLSGPMAAYRRISTTIELPAIGVPALQRQLSAIDGRALEVAPETRSDAAPQFVSKLQVEAVAADGDIGGRLTLAAEA